LCLPGANLPIAYDGCGELRVHAGLGNGINGWNAFAVGDADADRHDRRTTATATVQLTGNQATPAVAIASNANPALVQNSLILTATVTSGADTPTGNVTFPDRSTPLGTGTLADGVATLTTSNLTEGTHSIPAAYLGDQNFVNDTSSPLTQLVQDFSIN
jgi:hypothetical protein